MTREFAIRNTGDDSAEILVYGPIGDDWDGVSARTFAGQLKALGAVKSLDVRINSPGGNVIDGFAIYNALVRHQAAVTVHVDGWALSAATVVAMAGDEIMAAENALLMVHQASMLAWGNAADMRKTADILEKTDEQIAAIYTKRTGTEEEQVKAWMAAETWFTAAEAKEAGFITDVESAKELASACAFDPERFRFRNAPRQLAAMLEDAKTVKPDPAMAEKISARKKELDALLGAS